MCVHVYACVCACASGCVYVCVCASASVCVYVHACVRVCVYVCGVKDGICVLGRNTHVLCASDLTFTLTEPGLPVVHTHMHTK